MILANRLASAVCRPGKFHGPDVVAASGDHRECLWNYGCRLHFSVPQLVFPALFAVISVETKSYI